MSRRGMLLGRKIRRMKLRKGDWVAIRDVLGKGVFVDRIERVVCKRKGKGNIYEIKLTSGGCLKTGTPPGNDANFKDIAKVSLKEHIDLHNYMIAFVRGVSDGQSILRNRFNELFPLKVM